jgi:hypothetical protein
MKARKPAAHRPPKWPKVFKLLREVLQHVDADNLQLAQTAAAQARSQAVAWIPTVTRLETSTALAVRDSIDKTILGPLNDATAGRGKHGQLLAAELRGAVMTLERLVAREAAFRAVNRHQAALRRARPNNRTWHAIEEAAAAAVREVRRELGVEAFSAEPIKVAAYKAAS